MKTEFGRFGDLLEKRERNCEASNTIDASRKSRTIERKLKDVQELPEADGEQAIGSEGVNS